jgi:hypothetical protein
MKAYIVLLNEDEQYDHGRTEILAVLDSEEKAELRKRWLEDQVEHHVPKQYPGMSECKPFTIQKYRPEYLSIVEMEIE